MPAVRDTDAMRPTHLSDLVAARTLDARSAALVWLLLEGGVPIVVVGPADHETRTSVGAALLSADPTRPWVLLDADAEPITTERLAALLRGGAAVGITLAAEDLERVLEHLAAAGLPEDAVRRLGVVVVVDDTARGARCAIVHYLRPTERDAQGHLQRRPPAVLAAWDERDDAFEDYAWGITPELADRIDRSQADLEERQTDRARLLTGLADGGDHAERVAAYLEVEPPRVPAPAHDPAKPSPSSGGLTDPDVHPHQH